jgi:XXXCH domain-containing protein
MDLKTTKQEMETVFQSIQSRTIEGAMPEEKDVSQLLRLARQMQMLADDDWADECEDFQHLVDQLLHAVKKNQVSDAILLVESLSDAQTYCHRTFRG